MFPQTMGAIAATPWAIKGAIGVVSDMYPLWGYHKASYIIASAVVGSVAFFGLAALPISTPTGAAVLFFFANFEIATAVRPRARCALRSNGSVSCLRSKPGSLPKRGQATSMVT
jgi:hypothetical protein